MIFIDTWIWMEFLGKTAETEKAQTIIQSGEKKIISTAVLAELRYHCTKKFNSENTDSIIHLIESDESILIVPLTKEIAEMATNLRLKYYDKKIRDLSFIDVINLATAILTGCSKFYTGDKDFEGISEIKVENITRPKISDKSMDKDKAKKEIVEYIKDNKKVYPSDVANALSLDFDMAMKILKELEKKGRIKIQDMLGADKKLKRYKEPEDRARFK